MASDLINQPELTCQWCSGTIPEGAGACSSCGAARPRQDLVAPGFTPREDPATGVEWTTETTPDVSDDEDQARQILKDLDAYVPEQTPPPRTGVSNPSDDLLIVVIVLAASTLIGGLLGWFVAPGLIHDIFNELIGVDTDGPEAFRRLGAFLGAMGAMLFGALLVTIMRR